MQMSKINETNNSVKESLTLETVSLGQKSDVSSQVTADRQSATECLKKIIKNISQRKELLREMFALYIKNVNFKKRDARNATPGN